MIASLTGILKSKNPTEILIDVNGVGYSVTIPLSTYEKLGEVGSKVTLLTHLHIREDAMQLFGFASPEERFFFKKDCRIEAFLYRAAQEYKRAFCVIVF